LNTKFICDNGTQLYINYIYIYNNYHIYILTILFNMKFMYSCIYTHTNIYNVYVCYVGSKNWTLVFMAGVSQCFYQPTMTWFHNKISKQKNMFIPNHLHIQTLTCIFPYFVEMKQTKVHSTYKCRKFQVIFKDCYKILLFCNYIYIWLD